MENDTLPPPIAKQLSELEARRKRHQQMLEEHRDAPHRRREEHRARHFARSVIPITLV